MKTPAYSIKCNYCIDIDIHLCEKHIEKNDFIYEYYDSDEERDVEIQLCQKHYEEQIERDTINISNNECKSSFDPENLQKGFTFYGFFK
jgi:hypothetical protein